MLEGRKLYVVDVMTTVYVLADDDADAEEIAERAARHDCDQFDSRSASEVMHARGIPSEWIDSLPFTGRGNEQDLTIREILQLLKEEAEELQRLADQDYARNRPEQGRLFQEGAP